MHHVSHVNARKFVDQFRPCSVYVFFRDQMHQTNMAPKKLREKKRDFNQNLIEPPRSFEQLCNMINKLEKDSSIEITECNRMDLLAVDVKYDANLEPAMCKYLGQIEPEKDVSTDKCESVVTTYEDIMSFLGTLENEDTPANDITANNATTVISSCQNPSRYDVQNFGSIQRDDLETARLQIEERNATIECLKNQLKSERKAACDKMASQKRHHAIKAKELENKYRTIVKRHQKFIEQLLAEKTDLTQKCDSLARQIKEMEQKIQRDLKVITERHAVELQRAKENIAASEKIRRERWLEMKTSKIKEMTVKGLEPELHNMMEQHQQEIQELRRTHIKDLQDMELRAMRRSNQQLEQLRIELTDSHEKILAKEKDILVARYKEKLEEQEAHFQTQQKTFAEHFEREKSMLIAEQKKRDRETSVIIQQTELHFQKDTERLKEQYEIAKRNFEESLRKEWLAWADNYKKEQNVTFTRAEATIRNDCQKERDKQIEIAIVRLEKKSREMQDKLQQSFDNKLELMQEDYNTKLQAAIKSESIYKNKLLLLEEKFKCTEIQFEKTENKLKEYILNLNNMNETIVKLTKERDNAKDIARQEIETEKRELENKIASLYQEITQNNVNRDQLMAQLHSRIKLVVTQKVLIIKNLNKKLDEANSRSQHLEKLLDQQRKEYILKSL
ncbi:PREDICTED: LOW QUALITY PROTEIN: centrosomal protein of 131 kDa-like [Wasmannia auropunctata]|uniref:LOW QUALITY PROTEIN: centrosomal protein of 131 kDa-like n=1 Tax=Wasmannia auropunctata TaxID=64793 RepID=UPI0005EE367E|nr:PREDICTED: LOW QUALITY PROTEIN: centrosomal protein of 131 kDa-like [Wasmannia auropunctata]